LKQAEAKYTELNGAYAELQGKYRALQDDLNKANNEITALNAKKAAAENQISTLNSANDLLKQNNNAVLNQQKDLSVISGSQAESIKKSLENI
ncbi:hypothetical protein, partial [Salmonella enterica]|uniref:hypothetical protein n=1 Tax=Salmonella enterica TaxID=28901 RepID=UPI003D2DF2A9